MMNFFRAVIEDFRALRLGEQRIAPRSLSGRVYSKDKAEPPVGIVSKTKGVMVVKRRVYRAATDEWEDLPELRTEL